MSAVPHSSERAWRAPGGDLGLKSAKQRVYGTRLTFLGVCCYLLSQVFLIPILPLGPSWAVWPMLPDLAVGALIVGLVIEFRNLRQSSPANRALLSGLLLILGGTFVAFLFATVRGAILGVGEGQRTASFGLFQICRTAQFVAIFAIVAAVPITLQRRRILSRLVGFVFALTLLGLVGTYLGFIPTPLLVSHLPQDITTAGPWASLADRQFYDAGTIGYNHSYVALQIMMLAALAMALSPKSTPLSDGLYLSLATAGVFLSGSRAGLAAVLFLLAVQFLKRPQSLIPALVVLSLAAGAYFGIFQNRQTSMTETIERQLALGDPLNQENLSGRRGIWAEDIAFINADPVRWIIGAGPGSVAQNERNAHCLYLQIVMEAGVIGLLVFGVFFYRAIECLWRLERGSQAMLWVTVAFLFSALTQETFYPVPALGHFLGLYLCSLALVLSANNRTRARLRAPIEEDA